MLQNEEFKKPASKWRGSLNEIERQLEECQKMRDEYLVGWKKERADFLNYKREEAERISERMKFTNEELILKVLLILDSIYIADKKLPPNLKENQWVRGILRIKAQFVDFLRKQGIEEMKVLGKKFDPNFHEAIKEAKRPGFEPGIIVEEIKRGYLLNGRVIRPAIVKVSK